MSHLPYGTGHDVVRCFLLTAHIIKPPPFDFSTVYLVQKVLQLVTFFGTASIQHIDRLEIMRLTARLLHQTLRPGSRREIVHRIADNRGTPAMNGRLRLTTTPYSKRHLNMPTLSTSGCLKDTQPNDRRFSTGLESKKLLQSPRSHGSFAALRILPMQRFFSIALFAILGSVAAAQSDVPSRGTRLLTSWGAELTPDNVHSEYPRPTLVRSEWLNLNGYWDWKDNNERQEGFSRQILVPFPVESVLSGVTQHTERCVYRRTFTIPQHWTGDDHILLHFGAVDWEATVFINGQQAGVHRGGYDSFSLDITPFIRRNEPNELVVHVFDPSQRGEQPRGKQSTTPSGTWYTASTGVWQTVWLEPVPPQHIKAVQVYADHNTGLVTVVPTVHVPHKDLTIVAEVFVGKDRAAICYGGSDGSPLQMRLERSSIKNWSPDTPYLYTIQVQLCHRDTVVDTVGSYFAFRRIEIVKDLDRSPAVRLNGKRLFLMGVIDQGYWPDGLYTAPSDKANLTDIRIAKSLGFNVIRKYQKIEPERWYFWCDQLGILVWQDMPSGENRQPAAQQQFRTELQRMILSRSQHPAIIAWTIFNEGAGQHNPAEYIDIVRHLDPTRLINGTSGWGDSKLGDFNVSHRFPGPEMPLPDVSRAAIIGLFGGLTLVPPPEHLWLPEQKIWGYQHASDSDSLVKRYEQMHDELRRLIRTQGLAGAFFHQLADIESECNGLTTYNRGILKVPVESLERINRETIKIGSE